MNLFADFGLEIDLSSIKDGRTIIFCHSLLFVVEGFNKLTNLQNDQNDQNQESKYGKWASLDYLGLAWAATRRYLTLLDATRRYLTLLDAFRRYSTLLDATRRYSTLLDAI
jgi:hypothetical protein